MKNHHYLQSNSRKKTKKNGHIFWRRPKKVWKEIITVLPCSSLTNLWQIVKHVSSIFKLLWRKHRVVWMPGKRRVSSLPFLSFICFLKVSFFGDKMIVISESPDEIYNVRWRKLTASTSIYWLRLWAWCQTALPVSFCCLIAENLIWIWRSKELFESRNFLPYLRHIYQ